MRPVIEHPWNISESEALHLQETLSGKVIKNDQLGNIELVAGVDVAYAKESDRLVAAAVILDVQSLEVVEQSLAVDTCQFPYIPGLFSFREIPALIKAFAQLKNVPDLVVCDGQGYAHPRRFGLACHLGVLFDVPTIGCGKTRLTGVAEDPGEKRGELSPLIDGGEVVGNVLRTQDGVNPIYVSIGHRISLATACDWVLRLSPRYRLPESTRVADQLVRLRSKCLID